MGKKPLEFEKYFVQLENGENSEIIYDPPLLAKYESIRMELRKEKKHASLGIYRG